jgi:tripartite ATP-independent transporter DctM subunit
MEWYTILALVIGGLLALMLLGVPILFALGFIDVVLIVFAWGRDGYFLFGSVPFGEINNFVLLAVPLFILVGELVVSARINRDFFEMANSWIGWLPGGLAVTTQVMSTIFAAISGASTANTVIIGSVAAEELLQRGYDKRLTAGCIVAGGSLGMLIPPSTLMILYGVLNQVSIGHLFMGGVLPGLLISALFIAYILWVALRTPEKAAPARGIPWSVRWRTLWKVWAVLFLVLVMLGAIYTGVATPTEVGGLGALTAMVIALAYRRLSWPGLRGALLNTIRTTGFILWVLVAALLFGRVLTALGVTQSLTGAVAGLPLPPWGVLLLVNLLLLVLGAIMDPAAIVAVTSPILVPIMTELGYDPLWFGIIFMVNMELAFLTPPFGLNLFILKSIAPPQMSLEDIMAGAFPFMLLLLLGLGLVMVFPGLITWLPSTMS